MTSGKIAAQAGHAYVECFRECLRIDPDREIRYHCTGMGTKICLGVPNLHALLLAEQLAVNARIPHSLITDSGHMAFYSGQPIVTALGIGPSTRAEVRHIVKRFSILR